MPSDLSFQSPSGAWGAVPEGADRCFRWPFLIQAGGGAGAPTPPALTSAERDDAQLMEAVGRGDAGAYRELVQRHLRGVHAFAYRLLGMICPR